MSKTTQIDVKDLKLDLKNFRTIPQKDETDAVNAMIMISPDRFWALMLSLIEDGYIPTENIIAIKSATEQKEITVKEGNRRIAGLKLIHGYLNAGSFNLPTNIATKISTISQEWKNENSQVPCTVYEETDSGKVDKIINLTHGKGDKASRDKWTSVATARHNRNMNKASEPGLDLLEKYFLSGKNITSDQKDTWSGDYPITVLDEALKKIAPRVEEANAVDVAKKYPAVKYRDAVEKILSNIGVGNIGFKDVRNTVEDFCEKYGLPSLPPTAATNTAGTSSGTSSSNNTINNSNTANTNQNTATGTRSSNTNSNSQSSSNQTNGGQTGITTSNTNSTTNNSAGKAYAINDPKGVTKLLKGFSPSGLNRQKVVTLKNEALNLKLDKNPIAFCFLLRSMFEISVKAYFTDQSFPTTKTNGKDKTLKEMLNEAKTHLTNNGQNSTLIKELHGAITELNKSEGILSVTSMNQLVHNSTFSVTESDICTLFVQVFPLLKALN
ncbi:hypothetical protein GS399_03190 [Pedobacter sp. HMF7647]|uniref:DUF262 domain-containing protein n=1 Tax=Hufsiella arboris TaxID=2695275 RepID=A0A7K1Y5W3_9SPHI|nr:hypothetical protein [Hufsiella arboris]MXV49963.1 hypothetical protein [Hufsiella arboris]